MAAEPRRLRLLLATDSYAPFVGGADRQVQRIAYAMRDRLAATAVEHRTSPDASLVFGDRHGREGELRHHGSVDVLARQSCSVWNSAAPPPTEQILIGGCG